MAAAALEEGEKRQVAAATAESDEEDAFDRLIKKTYDRDCEKFFQRIDKLKRMNSCGGSSQRSKSSISNKTNTMVLRNRLLSSLSSEPAAAQQDFQFLQKPSKTKGQPTSTHMRLKSSLNLHSHSFSQL